METIKRYAVRMGALFLLVSILLAFGNAWPTAVKADTLPATTCTEAGGVRTCELWAKTGTLDLPGVTVTIWGYTNTSGGAATVPGPMLIANAGETLEVVLHNTLAVTTSLEFHGQALAPDLTGVGPGGVVTYTIASVQPGTYLYEAGLLPNAQHQVAMGLFGALIVRPATAGQAYDGVSSAYDDEALLVLSEIDVTLNNSGDPAAFDMRDYDPQYSLINGKVYSNTDSINITSPASGRRLLLRYVNAGIDHHSMSVLGLHQTVLAANGELYPLSYDVAGEVIEPGRSKDHIVTLPASADAAGGTRYAVYDGDLMLHNDGDIFGGMLTFIVVTDGVAPGTGPGTADVMVLPNPTDGTVDVTLSATINGAVGTIITAAEFFTDTAGADGTGVAMIATDGTFDSQSEAVYVVIPAAGLEALSSGNHTFYVHGQDNTVGWGSFNFATLNLDMLGPKTRGIVLTPNPSHGDVQVKVRATGIDRVTGNSSILRAEYVVDNQADPPTAMTVLPAGAPIAGLSAILTADPQMMALGEGAHIVYVRSQDAFEQWGPWAQTKLKVDKTGPVAANVVADPSPNNGALPVNEGNPSVRVSARITDRLTGSPGVNSTVAAAEGFIDTDTEPNGTGFPLTPSDGLYDEAIETAYAFIPLTTINTLSSGMHWIYIHGQDSSGNWGEFGQVSLFIERGMPTVSPVIATPNPTGSSLTTILTLTAADALSDIDVGEWFMAPDPGEGSGSPMAVAFNGTDWDLSAEIEISRMVPGDYMIYARARDAAGNWSAIVSTLLTVDVSSIFADGFESGDVSAWSNSVGAGQSVQLGPPAAMEGSHGMQLDITGGAASFLVDRSPVAETSYHTRFYFDPNGSVSPNGRQMTILRGRATGGTAVFLVIYRWRNTGGGIYQVRARAQTATGWTQTAWYALNENDTNAIEVAWEAGTDVSFSLYVNGTLEETLTALDTSEYLIESVQLGRLPTTLDPLSGMLYFDGFDSTRFTVIGP